MRFAIIAVNLLALLASPILATEPTAAPVKVLGQYEITVSYQERQWDLLKREVGWIAGDYNVPKEYEDNDFGPSRVSVEVLDLSGAPPLEYAHVPKFLARYGYRAASPRELFALRGQHPKAIRGRILAPGKHWKWYTLDRHFASVWQSDLSDTILTSAFGRAEWRALNRAYEGGETPFFAVVKVVNRN